MFYLCTIIKIRDMEEDNTQYFNDEWNFCKSRQKNSNPELQWYIWDMSKKIKRTTQEEYNKKLKDKTFTYFG